MKKISYLFVESPLQLLNAYEAIHKFNLRYYKILIRLSNIKENDEQIKFLAKYLNLKHIEFIVINANKKNLNDYIKLLIYKYKFKFKEIDRVFIGNFESRFFKNIMKQFDKNQIILLDDGAKTLFIQKQFSDDNFYNLFTIYDFIPLKGQKIYKNEYLEIQKQIKNLSISQNEIIFLGMKLSEIGIISDKEYIKLLEKVSKKYFDKKMIYIAHRGENKEKLEKLKNKINNLEIKFYNFPIELIGIFENKIPFKIISFYSTALLTMKCIYNIEVESYEFNYYGSKYKELINEVYKYYEKIIPVKKLNI